MGDLFLKVFETLHHMIRMDGWLAYSRLPLEGFVDLVAQVFDVNMVAVDFFDEALAADAELFGRAHLVELAGD